MHPQAIPELAQRIRLFFLLTSQQVDMGRVKNGECLQQYVSFSFYVNRRTLTTCQVRLADIDGDGREE